MPAMGSSRPQNDAGSVVAISPQLGTRSGSASRGTPKSVAELVGPLAGGEVQQQGPAGVGDVGHVPGAAGHPGDEVGVDGADGVPALLDQGPGVRLVLARARSSLVPEKYGSSRSPVSSVTRSSWPSARSRSQMSAVRRSCQTIARRGEPSVSRSQSRTVSRWLVMPTACSCDASYDASAVAGGLQGRLPDLLRGVLDPAGPREVLGELLVAPGRDPAVGGDDQRGDAGGAGVDGEDAHRADSRAASRSRSRICWSIHAPSGVDPHLVVLGADPVAHGVEARGCGRGSSISARSSRVIVDLLGRRSRRSGRGR